MAELVKERKKSSKVRTKVKKTFILDEEANSENTLDSSNVKKDVFKQDSKELIFAEASESEDICCSEKLCKNDQIKTSPLGNVGQEINHIELSPTDIFTQNESLIYQNQTQLDQSRNILYENAEDSSHSTKLNSDECSTQKMVLEEVGISDIDSDIIANPDKIQPFTEVQLLSLYSNLLLEERENIISEFLENNARTNRHEFYEIVLSYLHARTNLIGHQKELQTLQKDYAHQKDKVWTIEEQVTTEEGTCDDDQLVSITYKHDIAHFHSDVSKHTGKLLKRIRERIYDQHSLFLYTTELSKLDVENYLQKATSCQYFINLPQSSELTPDYLDRRKDYANEISHLKDCISVLFSFCRRNVQDRTFIRDTQSWLTDLVAILLRIANSSDHFFILNNLLRCPSGAGQWASSFLQVTPPMVLKNEELLGSTLLDHSLAILSILMEPVRNREKYLEHYKKNLPASDEANDSIWILVDSSGDEEEDACDMWHLFTENDIIQFLNQIPFEGIFRHILFIDDSNSDSCRRTLSMHSMLKFFAFCTCFIQVLSRGLSTYSKARYKGVIKRITRLIRHVVNYATDHLKILVDNPKTELREEDPALFYRLLIEYDEFFERAIKVVFLSPRSGAWQFLAVIPYSTVSISKLQEIAYRMHVGYETAMKEHKNEETNYNALLLHPDTRGQFQDLLLRLNESDVYYLLTALANMAIARPAEEVDFINVLVKSLFDASFMNPETRELLNRTGRDLLSMIVMEHPFVLSTLLDLTQENLQSLGSLCLYLFKFLNYSQWTPAEDDLQCLSYWLIFSPISSVENQLARIIFERLNWGFSNSGSELFLSRKIHQRVALLLVDAAHKVSSTSSQGNIISESVKHVTSVVYTPSHEQNFFKWAWSLMNMLHLHQLDQPQCEAQRYISDQQLMLKGLFDPSSSPSLKILQQGIANKNSFSIFSALLISTWGHSIPEFCAHGPDGLELMASEGHYEAVLTVISLVTPLFFQQHEELTSDSKFMNVIQKLINNHQTYISMAKSLIVADSDNGIRELFSSLIMDQIYNHKKYNFSTSETIVRFWMHLLTSISDWRSNKDVLKIINELCLYSIFNVRIWQTVKDILSDQRKELMKSNSDSRSFSSLLTWVTSNSTAPCSLLVASYSHLVPWFALTVFLLECEEQIQSGLWKNLLRNFQNDISLDLEEALKQTCEQLNIELFNSNYLSLYRLGQQLLSLNCDDAAFPLTLQAFLILHLSKLPSLPGNFDCSSVINKFYEGYINGNFLKKIKVKVSQCVSHWSSQLAMLKKEVSTSSSHNDQTVVGDRERSQKIKFLQELTSVLSAMQGWLEESRIYESGLYLPALPPHLMPDKLLLLFQENWDVWPELLDYNGICQEEQKLIEIWHTHRGKIPVKNSAKGSPEKSFMLPQANQKTSLTPFESILRRLKEYDPIKPIPPLPLFRNKSSTMDNNFDQNSIFYDVERHLGTMCNYSHTMYLWSRELCALDCVYTELLPQLWTNQDTKTVMTAKCQPSKKSKITECCGAASIVLEFKEKRLSESTNARLEQNREQYQSVMTQSLHSPPMQLVQGAIQLQALVNHVVHWHTKLKELNNHQGDPSLVEYGRKLFYHIVEQTNEETNSYPPAKQLISTSADLLGQEFLYGYSDCQKDLFEQVLTWDISFAGLLSPNFTPLVTQTSIFLELYSSLNSYVISKPDVSFMLLSKFEIETWLKMGSKNQGARGELLSIIASSLTSLLTHQLDDDPSFITCLELYRVHLVALLKQDFNRHFPQMLDVLLNISFSISKDPGSVVESLWYDLLNFILRDVTRLIPACSTSEIVKCLKLFSHNQTVLSSNLVLETVNKHSSYFIKMRLEHGLYGLYAKFQLHFRPILALVGLLSFSHIVMSSQNLSDGIKESVASELWLSLEGLWAGWISPLGGSARNLCSKWIKELTMGKGFLLPWTPGDSRGPVFAMEIFASSFSLFHETFVGCNILSLYLEYYHRTLASPEVPTYVLSVIHSQMSSLPWHHLRPSMKDIEMFSKIINEYLPECHSFIGGIFIQVPWNDVLMNILQKDGVMVKSENSDSLTKSSTSSPEKNSDSVRVHVMLLGILVKISMEPSVRQSGLLHPLLISAENFYWELLDGPKYETILNWFVMGCDSRIVLNMESRNPVDISLIQLLHVTAGYMPKLKHPEASTKRRLLVRSLIRLMTTSSTRHKALVRSQPSLFQATFAICLSHMEDVIVDLPIADQYQEGYVLASEVVMAIGGGASPPALQEICRDSMLQWLTGHHPTMMFLVSLIAALSKGVLHLHHRSVLMEGCLRAILSHAEVFRKNEESCWPEVIGELSFPSTNPMSMLSFAAQESHLFLIYAHTKWRLKAKDLSTEDEEMILSNLIEILPLINPDAKCEKALLLIVNEVLQLIKAQVERRRYLLIAWKHSRALADYISIWGEDRSSLGLLATIGWGRKSPLSVSIRLIFKSIGTFLLGQLGPPGFFTIINEHLDETGTVDSSEEAVKSLRQLAAIKNAAEYNKMKSSVDLAITFIQDCCHSILHAPILLSDLAEKLFAKDVILNPIFIKSDESPNSLDSDLSNECGNQEGSDAYSPTAPPFVVT